MNYLGKIVRLQIQRFNLKRGEKPHRTYDPAPLLAADELTLTRTGACLRADDGSFMVDVHNAAHPHSRNRDGVNSLSVGFTSHYAAMQARFGDHFAPGWAGENLLIATDQIVALEQVARGLVVQTARGPVALASVIVATPCKPFSGFALRTDCATIEELKAALQFLDHGMRGYYCALASAAPATIAVGDEVFAAEG